MTTSRKDRGGVNEKGGCVVLDSYGAVPAGKYVGQFFEHLGFTVVDEWYVLSEFHGSEENSTLGRMGNIKGLPCEQDLKRIEDHARLLASHI
jgi:hypothetical protein